MRLLVIVAGVAVMMIGSGAGAVLKSERVMEYSWVGGACLIVLGVILLWSPRPRPRPKKG